jgi:hypothetical protein
MGGTDTSKDPYNVNGFAKNLGSSLETSFGKGPAVFDHSLYAGMGSTTKDALGNLIDASQRSGLGFNSAIGYNTNLLQNGGLTSGMKDARSDINGIGGTYGDIADSLSGRSAAQTGWSGISGDYNQIADSLKGSSAAQTGYMGLYDDAGDKSLTEKTLMGVAKGNYLSGSDPYFEQNLQKSLGDASLGVNAAIGANGRYGSSVQADTLGSTLGNISSQARSANYQSEIARQQQALSAIEGQRQEGFTNQFNSLGAADQARQAQIGMHETALTGQGNALSQSDAARQAQIAAREAALAGQQGAAQTAFTMGQQGIGNARQAGLDASTLYNNSLLPAQTQLQAGQVQDADKQAALSGQNDLFRRQNDAQRDWALSYLGGVMPGGVQQTPAEVPWWQQLLGYVGNNVGQAVAHL